MHPEQVPLNAEAGGTPRALLSRPWTVSGQVNGPRAAGESRDTLQTNPQTGTDNKPGQGRSEEIRGSGANAG